MPSRGGCGSKGILSERPTTRAQVLGGQAVHTSLVRGTPSELSLPVDHAENVIDGGVPLPFRETWQRCLRALRRRPKTGENPLRAAARVCLTGPPEFLTWLAQQQTLRVLCDEVVAVRRGHPEVAGRQRKLL